MIECEEFWTLPHSYSAMATEDSELYKKLACSQLLIFKGIILAKAYLKFFFEQFIYKKFIDLKELIII